MLSNTIYEWCGCSCQDNTIHQLEAATVHAVTVSERPWNAVVHKQIANVAVGWLVMCSKRHALRLEKRRMSASANMSAECFRKDYRSIRSRLLFVPDWRACRMHHNLSSSINFWKFTVCRELIMHFCPSKDFIYCCQISKMCVTLMSARCFFCLGSLNKLECTLLDCCRSKTRQLWTV